jgi:outer membrane protein assembly factor BamB
MTDTVKTTLMPGALPGGPLDGQPRLSRRAALLMPLALGGCSLFDWLGDEAKPPIHGNREPVLSPARGLQIDAATSVELAPVVVNPDWAQPGGTVAHAGGNLAGGLTKLWSAGIGEGGDYRTRLTSQPLISGNQVFTMDTDGKVAAFDFGSGHRLWMTKTRPKKNLSTNLGGGITSGNGFVYAATGRAELLCLNAADGRIVWRHPLPSPARSAPTLVGETLYVCTIDQNMIAASVKDGAQQWIYAATKSDTGVLAQASPAYADGLVIAGFESGDIVALRAESGSLAWSDNLGTLKGTASLLEFASVRGAPVVDAGIVYAIGLGGLMAALDLRSGRRVWERDISGGNTPWLAGDILYVITDDQRCAAISKDDGTVHWVTDLPRFITPKRTKGLIAWVGPVLIAGKLIALSSNERMAVLDPIDGKLVSSTDLDESASMAPVAAEGVMLILTDDATLTAYK